MKPSKTKIDFLRRASENENGIVTESTYGKVSRVLATLDALTNEGYLLPVPTPDLDDYIISYRITMAGREVVRVATASETVIEAEVGADGTVTKRARPGVSEHPLVWAFTNYGNGKGHYRAEYKDAGYRVDFPVVNDKIEPTDRLWMTYWRISYYHRSDHKKSFTGGLNAPTLAEAKEICRVHAVTGEWNCALIDVSVPVPDCLLDRVGKDVLTR